MSSVSQNSVPQDPNSTNLRGLIYGAGLTTFDEMLHNLPDEGNYDEGLTRLLVPSDNSVIASLKRVRVEELANNNVNVEKDELCTLCLKDLANDEDEGSMCVLPCDHVFHEGCAVQWLKVCHFCPHCLYKFPTAAGN